MIIRERKNSTAELIGIKRFTDYGLQTSGGELLFFSAAPVNISVLSNDSVCTKIHHMLMILSTLPDIEISCTDSCECFDDNKAYLHMRIEKEAEAKVRDILRKDIEQLDSIQSETATARQFMFIVRCKNMSPEQVFQTANRVEKIITEQNFEVTRMKKDDIKKLLAVYFNAGKYGDQMPDFDGGQFLPKEGADGNEAYVQE